MDQSEQGWWCPWKSCFIQVDVDQWDGQSACGVSPFFGSVFQSTPSKINFETFFNSFWDSFTEDVYLPTLKLFIFAPENGCLDYCFPFGMPYIQGRTVGFRECHSSMCFKSWVADVSEGGRVSARCFDPIRPESSGQKRMKKSDLRSWSEVFCWPTWGASSNRWGVENPPCFFRCAKLLEVFFCRNQKLPSFLWSETSTVSNPRSCRPPWLDLNARNPSSFGGWETRLRGKYHLHLAGAVAGCGVGSRSRSSRKRSGSGSKSRIGSAVSSSSSGC